MNKKYNKGTYTGKGKGIGPLAVVLTVDDNHINDVVLHLENETSGVGKDAAKELKQQILSAQSGDIDGVSGASLTTRGVKNAVQSALEKAEGISQVENLNLNEGHFIGSAVGHGGEMKVDVSTFDNRIGQIKVISSHETPNVGDYAVKTIPQEIIKQQTLDVDVVTGATLTSKAIINATADAIQKANGDVKSWFNRPFHKTKIKNPTQLTTDLVIVGSGLSGLTTAAFAVKEGLKVVLIDKNDQVGGSSRYAGAIFAVANSNRLKELGVKTSVEELMDYVKKVTLKAKKPFDSDFLKRLLSESGKTFDELVSMTNRQATFISGQRIGYGNFANGAKLDELLTNYIEKHGGQIILRSRVSKILMSQERATGVEVENQAGKFTVKGHAIVIAPGGASYNQQKLLSSVTPAVNNVDVFNEANPYNTGDGYDLLKQVGANFSNNDVYKNGTIDFAPQLFYTWATIPDYSETMLIDSDGKRFTNEAPFERLNITTQMLEHGSNRYYVIYDGKNIDSTLKKKLDQLPENPKVYVHAKSIEELAQKLKVDANNLKSTYQDYQEAAQNGNDLFEKSKEKIPPFSGHDFYAVYAMPGSWGTIGGVKINHDTFQVKNTENQDFDNLYAVGEMSTSDLFSEYYMGGFSYATYTTEARLLADELVKKLI